MDPIPADVVERIWKDTTTLSIPKGKALTMKMGKDQPAIVAYLLAIGERDYNPDEAQLLFYLGMVVYRIFAESGHPPPIVMPKVIDQVEKANEKIFAYLEGEPESEVVKVMTDVKANYNQVEVLRYVTEALMEDPEEGCNIRPQSLDGMLMRLKTVIDSLDQAG